MIAAQHLEGVMALIGWGVFVGIAVFCVVSGVRDDARRAQLARQRRLGRALNPSRAERGGVR